MASISGGGLPGKMDKAVYDNDENDMVDEIEQGSVRKKKSDTLKHSHDAQASHDCDVPDGDVWEELKRITFTTGLKGAIRVKWDCQNADNNALICGESKLYDKNDAIIGSLHENGCSNTTVHTYTEDIDAANYVAGDYIKVMCRNTGSVSGVYYIHVTNFRVHYDENSEDFVNA